METQENTKMEIVRKAQPELSALMQLHAKPDLVPALVAQEIEYLNELMYFNPLLKECEPETMIFALKSVVRKGLTLDPEAGLCYLTVRNVKIGQNQWVKALKVTPSVNGELSMQRMAGRILDAKVNDPLLNDKGEFLSCEVQLLLPTEGGSEWRSFITTADDIKRLRAYSHKDRSRGKQDASTRDYSNALYRSGANGTVDLEFARTKAVKMAIKRAKTGMNLNESIVSSLNHDRMIDDLPPEIEEAEAVELELAETEQIQVEPERVEENNVEPKIAAEGGDFLDAL